MSRVQNSRARRKRVLAIAAAGLYIVANIASETKRNRRTWVKEHRRHSSALPLIKELHEVYPDDFKYLRMDSKSFEFLLGLVKDKIAKQDTVMRKSISSEERLTATIRFLATGRSFEDLKFSTGISAPSLCKIIPETCKAIYEILGPEYMSFPTTKEEWMEIGNGFEARWQFANCGGALGAKHIHIVPPAHSGAVYYNYKKFYSIVLMALVNSDYEFVFVDVGKSGRGSDGRVIEYTDLYRKLQNGELHLPESSETTNGLNFVFLSNETFPLMEHILKPYTQKELDHEKRIFNYRLSRAQNVAENAFGIISSRFRVLNTAINMKVEKTCYVILAICVLHNFLKRCSRGYISPTAVDREDTVASSFQLGDWRKESKQLHNLQCVASENSTASAIDNREAYKTYFVSEGSLPWQEQMSAVARG